MIRSYVAANALGPRANIAAPPATTERNWRRFNIVASPAFLTEMLGPSNLSVNKCPPDAPEAQAVPDNSSAIGVVTYRPTVYCNVTASEGGGGIANYNGNSWTGNTAKIIAPYVPNNRPIRKARRFKVSPASLRVFFLERKPLCLGWPGLVLCPPPIADHLGKFRCFQPKRSTN
jgi:hypothetical protein